MDSGKLRHPITVQTPTAGSRDAYGATTDTWSTSYKTRAEIVPQGARETYRSSQVHPEMTHLLRIRYDSRVTPEKRILYGTRVLNIVSVVVTEERNREMLVVCEEEL